MLKVLECKYNWQYFKAKFLPEKWGSCSIVPNSLRPHGLQPTRLLRPWDFPGKSTGVGCHCLLQEKCWRYLKIYTTNLNSSEKWSTPALHYIDRIDWKPSLIIRNHLILFHNTHYYLKYYLIAHCVPEYKQRACLSCSLNANAQHSV